MRVKLKKLLCLLCVLTLLFNSAGVLPALALSEAGDADAEMFVNPGVSGEEKEESGLFVMTGLGAAPGEESEQEAASVPGEDAQSATETVSQPGKPPEPVAPSETATLQDGSSVVTPDATPTLDLSVTQVSKKVGETASVTVTISGYPSGAYLQASNSNAAAYACVWGSWNNSGNAGAPSIPIRITGKNDGGGVLTISLKDTGNKTLLSKTVNVTITQDKPTLSFSPSSLSMKTGESKSSTLTINNYSGGGSISASVANSSVCSVRWGSWSGWSIPITVTPKAAGNTKVTVRLFNSAKTELASVTLNVEVVASATLSVSPLSLSVYTGESAVLTATTNGTLSNGDYFRYNVANSNIATAASSGSSSAQSLRLLVAGKSAGSTTLTVSLCSQSGQVLDAKTVPVTVNATPNNQRVSVSPTSVTVKVGSSVKVNCSGQNVSGAFSLRYVNNAQSLLDCAWRDSWSGNTVPVTITGKSAGSGSVTIQLLVGGSVVSTATIQVKVENDDNGGGGNNGGGNVGSSPSYAFDNYSKPGISLALCQYMFGKNQKAKTVYHYDIGNGGVCFGMSATSGLLSSPNAPGPSAFGKSSMTALKRSDYSSTYGLSLSDFIEAMHITQVSTSMRELSGISNMVSAVRNGGTSQPVIICVRGPGGGHAILGYGVDSSGSIIVYDSNWPGQARKVIISGNSWSYELWSGKVWNSNNGRITYIPYSNYSQIWQNRGSLNGAILQDGGLLNDEDPSRYLLATTAHDFELAVFDESYPNDERVIAVYENGVLTKSDPIVEEAFVGNVPLNSDEPAPVHMLYVPGEDLYTVHNRTGGMMDVTLSGEGLSVRVNSKAASFDLGVSDDDDFVAAQLNGLKEGQEYSISVGTSNPEEGEPEEASIEGVGNGQPICMGMGGPLGIGVEGLYVSNGAAGDGTLSLNAVGDEDAEQKTTLSMDFALNVDLKSDAEYPLTAETGEGGWILSPDGKSINDSQRSVVSVPEGGNHTFRIQPEGGYKLKAVYVNGVEAAYSETESDQPAYSYYDGAYEYTFRDVDKPGYLYAEFAKDISDCRLYTDHDAGNFTVEVSDGDKVLLEGVDYDWSVSNVEEDGQNKTYLTVQAVSGGDYYGVLMEPYEIHTDDDDAPALIVTASNPDETTLLVKNVENPFVMAIAYALPGFPNAGQMLAMLPGAIGEKTADGITVRISQKDAQLSGAYALKAFLFSDADAMRVLCDPVNIGGGGGSSSGGGGGAPAMRYYLTANAVKEGPADGAVWLSPVQPTAENIETITNGMSSLNLIGTSPNVIFYFYAVLEPAPGVNADYAVNSGSVVNAEEIAGRKVLTIRGTSSYYSHAMASANPLTVTATFT